MRRVRRTVTGTALVSVAAVVAVLASLVPAGCSTAPTAREIIDRYPVKHLAFYDFHPETPVSERITDAPDELLDLYEEAEGVRPIVYTPSSDERRQIVEALALLPLRHQEVLRDRLIAIYCIDEFAGTGMADWVIGPDDTIYATLILHRRVFDTSAAELLEYRASSAFADTDDEIKVEIDLSESVSLLQYITLHEVSHIVDYVDRDTPFVEPFLADLTGASARDTTFTDLVWRDYRSLRREIGFRSQPLLSYYGLGGDPALDDTEMEGVYRELSGTPLASLYASLNWAEDFAEFVTFYYLVHVLGSGYSVRVVRGDDLLVELHPMASPSVADRIRFVDPTLVEPSATPLIY